jgi:hypothetical protein
MAVVMVVMAAVMVAAADMVAQVAVVVQVDTQAMAATQIILQDRTVHLVVQVPEAEVVAVAVAT